MHIEIAIMQTCTLGQMQQSLGKPVGLPALKSDNQPQEQQAQSQSQTQDQGQAQGKGQGQALAQIKAAVKASTQDAEAQIRKTTRVSTNSNINITGTGFSLKKKLSKSTAEEDQNEAVSEAPTAEDYKTARAFTEEEFMEAWKSMCMEVDISNNLKSTLINSKLRIDLKNFHVMVPLMNTIQESRIKEVRQDILNFMRAKMNNKLIQVETIVEVGSVTVKPYGPEEKFNKLFEKNPLLKDFKEALGLDIEL